MNECGGDDCEESPEAEYENKGSPIHLLKQCEEKEACFEVFMQNRTEQGKTTNNLLAGHAWETC